MAEFQTSFIPKKSFDQTASLKKKSSGIVLPLAVIIFLVSAFSAGGVFLYEKFLNSSIERKKESLETAKAAFEPELIRQLSRLGIKLATAESLLGEHVALSSFFEFLEEITLETIRFNSFSYTIDETGLKISMEGEALSFAAVALQSDEFAKQRYLREPVFSGLDLDDTGNVEFMVTAYVDPALVSYRDRASRGATAVIETEDVDAVADVTGTTSPNTN